MNIAVLLNDEGVTTSFSNDSFLKIYRKVSINWVVKKEMQISSIEVHKPNEIRSKLKQVKDFLEDCNVIIVKEMKGIYFTYFEGMSFDIWEMEGNPERYLDYVYESEMQERKKNTFQKKPLTPEEIKPGFYYINLKEVMSDKNSMTSKQILLPFFQETSFEQIIIDCDHIPRWFQKDLPDMGLNAEAQKFRDGMKVIVTPEKK